MYPHFVQRTHGAAKKAHENKSSNVKSSHTKSWTAERKSKWSDDVFNHNVVYQLFYTTGDL